jgi:hypothetical protein
MKQISPPRALPNHTDADRATKTLPIKLRSPRSAWFPRLHAFALGERKWGNEGVAELQFTSFNF